MSLALLVQNFNGKNRVCQAFSAIAKEVVKTHNLPADPERILFLQDEQTEKRARTASDIVRIPEMWRDVLFQLTLKQFDFAVKFVNVNVEGNPRKLFLALMYHELRHIKEDAKTGELYLDKRHDIEDWQELAQFGDWENDKTALAAMPDMMTAEVKRKEFAECGRDVHPSAQLGS